MRVLYLVLAVGFLTLGCDSGHAETRVALVIGNGAYTNAARLPNPRNDAEDVAAALRRSGFEAIIGLDLDKTGMEDAAVRFARAARRADVALFYYSGHAMQYGGVNYLMPVDADLKDEADLRRMTRVDEIVADLQQAKNLRILVLDACRDNPLAEDLKRSIGRTRAASLGRGLARIDSPEGMIVAFSTQSGRTADDGSGRNSPYTQAFLRHIETSEEIGRVFRRISTDVYEATGKKQLPEVSLSLIGEFYLRGQAAPSSTPLQAAIMPLLAPVSLAGDAPTKALQDAFARSTPDSVFFNVGEAVLRAEAQLVLDSQAKWLLANPKVRVRIYGNADEREGDALLLGAQRAKAVRDYLLRAGVPPGQVGSTTYGLDLPLAASSDETSWAMNRRVQTKLVSVSRN